MENTITTTLNNKPVSYKPATRINNANQPEEVNFLFIFLLGIIASKWCINHNKKRMRIYLPETKRYLALALQQEWGGTVSRINRDKHHNVMWQITSTRSLQAIREAALAIKTWLPPEFYQQLMMFLQEHI
jgi:hypothetical protein